MNKRGLIVGVIVVGILLVVGFFWFVGEWNSGNSKNGGMNDSVQLANPASIYCVNQGHRLEIRSSKEGEYGVCVSSDGEECEEWEFFRGTCDFVGFERCVAASCCHAKNCVWESVAPDCSGAICTASCEDGTMDCGAGECGVVDRRCDVVWSK